MNLAETTQLIESKASNDSDRDIAKRMKDWLTDGTNIFELQKEIEDKKESASETVIGIWNSFNSEELRWVNGMTMNERLFALSLFPRWDSKKTEEERLLLYHKVNGNP